MAVNRPADVPDAPTHASLVKKAFGDGPARKSIPNPNRGDNLSGDRPYVDSAAPAGSSFGPAATRKAN
jgi:hypothetical protein